MKYRKFSTDSWLPETDQNQIELFDLDITGNNTIPQGKFKLRLFIENKGCPFFTTITLDIYFK